MDKSCLTCLYFSGDSKSDTGVCRRRPPVMVVEQYNPMVEGVSGFANMTKFVFPDVSAESWCGEYEENGEAR